MLEPTRIILYVGLLAQLCFAMRQITQWYASEKAKSVQSPISFWTFSLLGSIFFFVYGILREDFAIVLGQLLNFYIYCRNLFFKGMWSKWPIYIRIIILSIPILALAYVFYFHRQMFYTVLSNDDISSAWLVVGTLGYLLFTIRFVYQWYVSEKIQTSKLPVGFFVLSIVGSLMIISYGYYRSDMILVFGYLGGMVVYVRNLMIHYQTKRQD